MYHDSQLYDLLLIEDSTSVIDLFLVLTKKFDLKIKIVKNSNEFMNVIRTNDFKFVLCDSNLNYKYEGLFIARVYNNIRKIKRSQGKILLFSSELASESEIGNFKFDDVLQKDFLTIYEFLLNNFPLRSYHDLIKNDERYIVSSQG